MSQSNFSALCNPVNMNFETVYVDKRSEEPVCQEQENE